MFRLKTGQTETFIIHTLLIIYWIIFIDDIINYSTKPCAFLHSVSSLIWTIFLHYLYEFWQKSLELLCCSHEDPEVLYVKGWQKFTQVFPDLFQAKKCDAFFSVSIKKISLISSKENKFSTKPFVFFLIYIMEI